MGVATTPAEVLRSARTIAVVGMSATPHKAAHRVPAALLRAGWHLIPVNPATDSVLGIPARDSLDEVTEPVDIVDVFRPSAEAADVARQAVAIGARCLWLQLGIVSAQARAIAEAAGLTYIEDTCIDVVRREAGISPPGPAATPAS
jgi:predicted CoA-binding protein